MGIEWKEYLWTAIKNEVNSVTKTVTNVDLKDKDHREQEVKIIGTRTITRENRIIERMKIIGKEINGSTRTNKARMANDLHEITLIRRNRIQKT